MDTLTMVHRNNVGKCVQCHVVGLGKSTGYQMSQPDRRLAGVQCEICHGSGGMHVQNPIKGNIRRTPTMQVCLECHDREHSDNFEARFEAAWAAVRH